MRSHTFLGLVGLFIVLQSIGCRGFQTYEGPRKLESEVARLWGVGSSITAFDGEPADWREWATGGAELLPGYHTITVHQHWSDGHEENLTLGFHAEAGSEYSFSAYDTGKESILEIAAHVIGSGAGGIIIAVPLLLVDSALRDPDSPSIEKYWYIIRTSDDAVVAGYRPPKD